MKNICNTTTAACTHQLAANGLRRNVSSTIFSLLLFSFILLLSKESVAQVSTIYPVNRFNTLDNLYIQTESGRLELESGQLRAYTATGSNAYHAYVAISNRSFNLKKGFTYTVSFSARALDHNQGGAGSISVLRGNASNINWNSRNASVLANGVVAKSTGTGMTSYNITFKATDSFNSQFLALKLSTAGGNRSELYLDNLTIRESCAPATPQVTSNGSCSTNVPITLIASGAVSGIEEYRWYTEAIGGTPIANATEAQYVTPSLSESRIYYVSIYSNETSCESPRIPVMASIGGLPMPTVKLTTGSCEGGGNETKIYTASGGSEGNYRWYSVGSDGSLTMLVSNGQPIAGSTLSRNTNSDKGNYAVSIVGSGCESEAAVFSVVQGYPSAPSNNASGVICDNQLTLRASGASLGESYNWYATADGVTAFIGQGAIFVTSALEASTTYTVSKVNMASGCESLTRRTATVTEPPLLQYNFISGNATVCQGITTTYSVPSSIGATYTWLITNNNGYSGATITSGANTNQITVSYPSAIYFGEVSVTVSNACSSYSSKINVQASNNNVAIGEIIEPANLELGKRGVFKFETNVPDGEIVALQWYQRIAPSNEWSPIQTINGRDIEYQQMPGNINGFRVDIQVRSTTAGAHCITGLGLTGTYAANSFTISNTSIVPLPVELVAFKAQRHTKGVNLTWATASEQDNSGFEVQVSTDSRNFQKVGFVGSKVGTSSIRQDYSFLDTRAVTGTRYYRLKQVDFDGTAAYSAIKSVSLDGGNGSVAAYPNPFDDVLTVRLNGAASRNVKVILTNMIGDTLWERTQEAAGNSISLDMRQVTAKGVYILHVIDSDTRHTFKLMKR